MRTFIVASVLALAATSAGEAGYVSVMPHFWAVMDADHDADTRAQEFERRVLRAHGALYGPVIPVERGFDAAGYLAQLEPFLPAMRELEPLTRRQVDASATALRGQFGDLTEMSIFVAPSLFTSNGQVRVVDDRPVVVFGLDVQAYAEAEILPAASRNDLRAFVAHELFHGHHYGVNADIRGAANTLVDPQDPAPVFLNLWIEGLATCVSMSVDGDGSIERALMSERLPVELPPVLGAVARELGQRLDVRSVEVTRDFFWLDGERADIPPRSAYAVGALVADEVIERHGLTAAVRLSGDELREEVRRALWGLEERTGTVDWPAACDTLRR
jgi:hypothetical protein